MVILQMFRLVIVDTSYCQNQMKLTSFSKRPEQLRLAVADCFNHFFSGRVSKHFLKQRIVVNTEKSCDHVLQTGVVALYIYFFVSNLLQLMLAKNYETGSV